MEFSCYSPTRIFFGSGVVGRQAALLAAYGRKALVVAGHGSFRANGAWRELSAALKQVQISYELFEGVEPNPSLETVERGRLAGLNYRAEFVIAVGGGSALDAAKAIAALIAQPNLEASRLVEYGWRETLPLVAIPTTAGTGSEVTPYAVLTYHDQKTKRALNSPLLFPRLALVDPCYTYALPADVTLHTGLDAWSHLIEGYLSQRANPVTDSLAEKGFALFGACLPALRAGSWTPGVRDRLALVSLLGGLVIATTGTATVHALGFPLTYHKNFPHGLANGVLLAAHLRRCETCSDKVGVIYQSAGQDRAGFEQWLKALLPAGPRLTPEEIAAFAAQALPSKNHENNLYPISDTVLRQLLTESLG